MFDWSQARERAAISALRWMPKGAYSRAIGWLARRPLPQRVRPAVYGTFAQMAGADLSLLDRPLDAFESLEAFFTRPLRDGARPIDREDGVIVSPADGVLSQVGVAEGERLIQAKGRDYTIRGLLGDSAEARFFENGSYATIYLAPRDYHRVHVPVGGHVTGYHHIPGAFYPVNGLSVRNVEGLFSVNERLITYLDSDVGRVAVVMVAAVGVGHITLSYEPGVETHLRGARGRVSSAHRYGVAPAVQAGDELGIFHLGSTVILLFEQGRVTLEGGAGDPVRVGRRIGRRSARSGTIAA